ncbi:hypothetical protein [Marinobacter sp.]|uniref:hypothetical protein n=1 Tax=Marinobacter sp. TaxID=50741 RepID=UPI0034A4673A
MYEIILPERVAINAFMKRSRQSLLNNFKSSSGKQLHQAAIFANYLVALDFLAEAIEFLEGYVNDIECDDENIDQWGHVGQGIILLSALYRRVGSSDAANKQLDRILKNDIVVGDKAEDLAYRLSDHEGEMEYAETQTKKYRCEMISQEILRFLYYLEMWPQFKVNVHPSEKEVVESLVQRSYEKLRDALCR